MALAPEDALRQAADALADHDLVWAEALVRAVLEKNPGVPPALELLGSIAERVESPRPRPRNGGYLLIKTWARGFWSDVDHVLGALLVCEMTGRTPVIHWGQNSKFTEASIANAWPQFFEPLNDLRIDDVIRDEFTYFPAKWSASNLRQEDLNVMAGPHSRVTNLALLNRPEDVVVADFHVAVPALIPWIEDNSPHFRKTPPQLYSYLLATYLRPAAHVQRAIDEFHARHLRGHRVVAVHFRGSDKWIEQRGIEDVNRRYFEHVDAIIAQDPQWGIFLLTDDAHAAAAFRARYRERVVMTDVERSADSINVFNKPAEQSGDGIRRGVEVMLDTFLAARADKFVGNGGSNVTSMIVNLKPWSDTDVTLLAPIRQYRTMPVLYRPR